MLMWQVHGRYAQRTRHEAGREHAYSTGPRSNSSDEHPPRPPGYGGPCRCTYECGDYIQCPECSAREAQEGYAQDEYQTSFGQTGSGDDDLVERLAFRTGVESAGIGGGQGEMAGGGGGCRLV